MVPQGDCLCTFRNRRSFRHIDRIFLFGLQKNVKTRHFVTKEQIGSSKILILDINCSLPNFTKLSESK